MTGYGATPDGSLATLKAQTSGTRKGLQNLVVGTADALNWVSGKLGGPTTDFSGYYAKPENAIEAAQANATANTVISAVFGKSGPKPGAASDIHPTFAPGPYARGSVPATSAGATPEERAAINVIGNVSGCHTCGTVNPGTKKGTWVPDHQTPTALNNAQVAQSLHPHCLNCSREQGLAIIGVLRGGNGW